MKHYTAGGHTHSRWEGTEFEELEKDYYNNPHYNAGIFAPLKKEKTEAFKSIGDAFYNLAVLCERTRDYYTACAYFYNAYKYHNRYATFRRYKYLNYIIYEDVNVKRLYSVKGILNEKERESKDYRKVDNLYIKRVTGSWGSI